MKKELFVFGVLAMVLVACKPAVKGGDTSNSETPLELTAANLAGRWVLEGDSTKWYEFKKDGTYTRKDVYYPYSITGDKVNLKYKDGFNNMQNITKKIVLYKSYLIIETAKYIKQ